MNAEKEITKRILALMQERNITAKELTSTTGISRTAVSEWKANRTTPSVDHIRRLADFFSVSTDYLINGNDFTSVVISDAQLNEMLDNSMVEVFRRLSLNDKTIVHDFFIKCLHNIQIKAESDKAEPDISDRFDPLADFEARKRRGEFD